MENVYEIVEDEVYGEYIRVENRGTDFSGYSHGQPRDQELPAFYGVAALPRLATYKGNNAWTNDAIQYENNLPFWSGATATAANRFKASENWIAWVNEENWGDEQSSGFAKQHDLHCTCGAIYYAELCYVFIYVLFKA